MHSSQPATHLHAEEEDQHLRRHVRSEARTEGVDDGVWAVTFMAYDLGYIDVEQKILQPIDNRPAHGVTSVLGTFRHPRLRYGPPCCGGGSGIRTHDTVARIHAFQACAFSHSAIPPAPAGRRRRI